MSYVVLARRFRPQTLDQIIGQEHVSRTLKNAIAENRVAHAYIFSGPRGVGKTTTARILAKALNCKNGPTAEPCGKCSNCVEITQGTNVDVQEIDGASNRGIDEIRALRENVKFAPATSKYKIYIIDEAHQITDAAFNALLKTLEEPPEHVVFILATTEQQKIPITILSRCQRYRFRLLSAKEISTTLEKIIQTEGYQVEPQALQVITMSAGGSLRDALSLLDQAVSFVSGKVTVKDMQDLLGFMPRELIVSATAAIAGRDYAGIMKLVKEITEQGYNLLQFARDLREHFRRLMLIKINPDVLEITADEKTSLQSQQSLFSPEWLVRSNHLLSRALDEMRWSDQPRLILELYLTKIAQPYAGIDELITRIERLEKGLPAEETPPPARATVREEPAPYAAPAAASAVQEKKNDASVPAASAAAPSDIAQVWKETVVELQRTRPIIGSVASEAILQGLSGTNILIGAHNAFQLEGLKRNQALIEDMLAKKAGRRYGIKVSLDTASRAPAPEATTEEIIVSEEMEQPSTGAVYQVEGELGGEKSGVPPGLEKIMDKFPGRITKKKNN